MRPSESSVSRPALRPKRAAGTPPAAGRGGWRSRAARRAGCFRCGRSLRARSASAGGEPSAGRRSQTALSSRHRLGAVAIPAAGGQAAGGRRRPAGRRWRSRPREPAAGERSAATRSPSASTVVASSITCDSHRQSAELAELGRAVAKHHDQGEIALPDPVERRAVFGAGGNRRPSPRSGGAAPAARSPHGPASAPVANRSAKALRPRSPGRAPARSVRAG